MRARWLAAPAVAWAAFGIARRLRSGASLRGEVAIVTGGSRGLGFLIAERLLEEGCRVAICGRDERTLTRARRKLTRDPGGEVLAVPCDVADEDEVADMVRNVERRLGPPGILVNNAAIIQVAPLEALDVEDFRQAVDVAFMGTVHATLAVLPGMRSRGRGRIANITSIGGKVAVPHLLPYDCAKFAAVGFSEGLRASVAKDGITVTTVVPGLMRTGSPVHVEYRGQPRKEFAWFALGDLLPGLAMSAERIVRAIRRGEAEVTLSWQAKALRVAYDVSPAGMGRLLGVVDRILPGPPDGRARSARGRELEGVLPGPATDALDRAGRRANQAPGSA